MPNGVPAKLRGLNADGIGILVDLLSAYSKLVYRGVVVSGNEEAINNAKEPGVYNHGSGLFGTGSSWHGILIVLKADTYIIQIDIPLHPQDHAIFWRLIGGPWEKITSVTV